MRKISELLQYLSNILCFFSIITQTDAQNTHETLRLERFDIHFAICSWAASIIESLFLCCTLHRSDRDEGSWINKGKRWGKADIFSRLEKTLNFYTNYKINLSRQSENFIIIEEINHLRLTTFIFYIFFFWKHCKNWPRNI